MSVNPATGSGNGTVNMSSVSPHTGRTARQTVATFKANGVDDIPVSVNQAGKPEFVSIAENAAATKAGGNVTVSGKSNSSKLKFTLGSGSPVSYTHLTLPTN